MKRTKGALRNCALYTQIELTICHGNVYFTMSNERGATISGYVPVDVWRASVRALPPPDNKVPFRARH
jgi:hypothetical protein